MYLEKIKKKIKENKFLSLIILFSFVIPVLYSFNFRIDPVVDAQAYDTIAINIVEGYGFIEDRTSSFEFDTSIVRAGPGYEYFLAGIYFLFGHHFEPVWVIQAFLHALSALLLYLVARQLFRGSYGERVGVASAAIFGFSPDLIEISAMLMTETLYLFFTVLVFYLFLRVFNKPKNNFLAFLLGLASGVAILTRPPIVLFVPVFLFFYYRKKEYKNIFILIVGCAIALLPWVIRNYLIYNQLILTTMIAQYNLWVGNTLLSDGGQIAGGFNVLTNYTDSQGFFGLKAKANAEFFSFLATYPFVFIKLTFIRFIRYFSLIRPMGFWFYQTGISQMAFIFSSLVWIAFLFVTGFSGLVVALREKKEIFYYLAIFALTSPLVLLPTVVQSRYRFQIYPFLAIFSGYLIVFVMSKKEWFRQKVFLYPTLFLVAVSVVDLLFNFNKVIDRLGRFF